MKKTIITILVLILITSCVTTQNSYQNDDIYSGIPRQNFSDTTRPQNARPTIRRNIIIAPSPYWIYRPNWYSPYWYSPYWNYRGRYDYYDSYGWRYNLYPSPWRHRRPRR